MANGVFGLRPSLGSYNISDGVVPAFFTRDTIGEQSCLIILLCKVKTQQMLLLLPSFVFA